MPNVELFSGEEVTFRLPRVMQYYDEWESSETTQKRFFFFLKSGSRHLHLSFIIYLQR